GRKQPKAGPFIVFIQHPSNTPEVGKLPYKLYGKQYQRDDDNRSGVCLAISSQVVLGESSVITDQWRKCARKCPYEYGNRRFTLQWCINKSIQDNRKDRQHACQEVKRNKRVRAGNPHQ